MKYENCIYHEGRPASSELMVEGGGIIKVCEPCQDRILHRTRYVCRYCGIPIKSRADTSARLEEKPHKPYCRRHPHNLRVKE